MKSRVQICITVNLLGHECNNQTPHTVCDCFKIFSLMINVYFCVNKTVKTVFKISKFALVSGFHRWWTSPARCKINRCGLSKNFINEALIKGSYKFNALQTNCRYEQSNIHEHLLKLRLAGLILIRDSKWETSIWCKYKNSLTKIINYCSNYYRVSPTIAISCCQFQANNIKHHVQKQNESQIFN